MDAITFDYALDVYNEICEHVGKGEAIQLMSTSGFFNRLNESPNYIYTYETNYWVNQILASRKVNDSFVWNGHQVEGYEMEVVQEQFNGGMSDVYYLVVPTLEGAVRARIGDTIIKTDNGHLVVPSRTE